MVKEEGALRGAPTSYLHLGHGHGCLCVVRACSCESRRCCAFMPGTLLGWFFDQNVWALPAWPRAELSSCRGCCSGNLHTLQSSIRVTKPDHLVVVPCFL